MYYRVKEFNHAYDSFFPNGIGWIYVSNAIKDITTAALIACNHEEVTGRRTSIDLIMNDKTCK